MPRKHYKAEAIILKLREAEVLLGQGAVLIRVIFMIGPISGATSTATIHVC